VLDGEDEGPFLERQQRPVAGAGPLGGHVEVGAVGEEPLHAGKLAHRLVVGMAVDGDEATQRMIQPMRGTRRSSILATIRKVRGRTAKMNGMSTELRWLETMMQGGGLPGFPAPPPPTGRPRATAGGGPICA